VEEPGTRDYGRTKMEMKRLADPDVLAFAAQRINALKAQGAASHGIWCH
jgi:hypothetical protein